MHTFSMRTLDTFQPLLVLRLHDEYRVGVEYLRHGFAGLLIDLKRHRYFVFLVDQENAVVGLWSKESIGNLKPVTLIEAASLRVVVDRGNEVFGRLNDSLFWLECG